jgi:hypothetical protein
LISPGNEDSVFKDLTPLEHPRHLIDAKRAGRKKPSRLNLVRAYHSGMLPSCPEWWSAILHNFWRVPTVFVSLTLCFALGGCHQPVRHEVEPKISFTQVPERNSGSQNKQDVMEGTITGAKQGQRLVMYSKSGGLWWLQPLLTAPFTPILSDGVWRNETHVGTDYAVLLVDPGYHPVPVLDHLPRPGQGVITSAVSPGQQKSSSYFIDFSGFSWRVRWKPSDRGGAVNPYNPDNVYVDPAGALHLRIVNRDQQWTCSEVNLTQSLGYGTYSFTVEDTSQLEPSVLFGIFTWDYSTDQENHREFNIDFSRRGDPQEKNAEFVLQPAVVPTNVFRFTAPVGKLKHTIVWEPGRLTMTTARVSESGHTSLASQHVFTSEVPTPGFESLRMTLFPYRKLNEEWLGLQRTAEVVVDRFEYLP